jgi:hypothetical protein
MLQVKQGFAVLGRLFAGLGPLEGPLNLKDGLVEALSFAFLPVCWRY